MGMDVQNTANFLSKRRPSNPQRSPKLIVRIQCNKPKNSDRVEFWQDKKERSYNAPINVFCMSNFMKWHFLFMNDPLRKVHPSSVINRSYPYDITPKFRSGSVPCTRTICVPSDTGFMEEKRKEKGKDWKMMNVEAN